MLNHLFRSGGTRYSRRQSPLEKLLIFAVYLGLIVLGAWVFTAILDLVS